MNFYIILLLLTVYTTSASQIILKTRQVIHLELNKPGSIAINGIKYRESSGTESVSQFTVALNPGNYDFGEAFHKVMDGVEVVNINPIKPGALLSAIMAKRFNQNVMSDHSFILLKESIVGFSYHLELWQKPGCNGQLGSVKDLQIIVRVDNKIVNTVIGNSINGINSQKLSRGPHNIQVIVTNTGAGLWGSFPSLEKGFSTGRYLFVWQTPIDEKSTVAEPSVKIPEAIHEDVVIPDPVEYAPELSKTLYDVLVGIPHSIAVTNHSENDIEKSWNFQVNDTRHPFINHAAHIVLELPNYFTLPSIWSM